MAGDILHDTLWDEVQPLLPPPSPKGGHHRVLSRARGSLWPPAWVLATMVLGSVPAGEPVVCSVGDTTPQHKGKGVWSKGRHLGFHTPRTCSGTACCGPGRSCWGCSASCP